METILERLPNTSDLGSELKAVSDKFTNISLKVSNFSPADLTTVLEAGANLPIPGSFALVSDTLNSLSLMAEKIPSEPEKLTSSLREGLENLKTNSSDLSELLGPIVSLLDVVAPLLEKFDFLSDSVTRINTIVSGLSERVDGLNLANLPEQLEYFSRVFGTFPEVGDVSPFKELKAQLDTLKAWLTSSAAELTESFRNQILTLAEALPTQLNQVMQAGKEAIAGIEAPILALDHSVWCAPYTEVLKELEAIDLNDLSKINDYLNLLNTQVTKVQAISETLANKGRAALGGIEDFDVDFFSQELRNALLSILNTVSPEKPSVLAALFQQIQTLIGGLEVGTVNSAITQVEQEIDKLIGEKNFSEVTKTIEDITKNITSTVEIVDRGLVEVATFLSNLVTELQTLIADIDLPGLMSQVETAFTQLSERVNELISQVKAIPAQIEEFIKTLEQDIQQIDSNTIANGISSLLDKITSVLDDPQLQQIIKEAQQGIDEIAKNLENVSLKPVFDRVVSEINDLTPKLASIDASQLNDLLKKALKTALEEIVKIDFSKDVADKLTQQLQEILQPVKDLIKPLQDKYKEIVGQINQFAPGALVSEKLSPLFKELLAELNSVEPAKLLAPLKDLYQSVLALVEPLEPNTLLAPLTEVHGQLLNSLKSLSPHELIAPLNQLLSEVTSLLNQLGIETFITKITDSVGKINTLIGNLSMGQQLQNTNFWPVLQSIQLQGNNLLQDAQTQVDRFLDKLVEPIPDIDMSILQPVLNQLNEAIATIKNHANNPEVLTQIDSLKNRLNATAFKGCVTDLTKRWLAQKARFEQITPPPELQQSYETLKERVRKLSPIQLLAVPVTLVDRLEANLETMQGNLSRTKEGLVNLLMASQDKLDALLPDESTVAGFKRLLRDGLDEQIGNPAKNLLRSLTKKLADFGTVLEAIKAIALKFQGPFEALTIIPNTIETLGKTLIDTKNKITDVNFNFLEDELQGVIDEVIAQLSSLNPATLLSNLETIYKNLLTELQGLYPDAAIGSIDKIYREIILTKIAELDPAITIGKPLDTKYQEILKLQQQLSVDKIFDALTGKLDTLDKELKDGLHRSETAFDQMIAAVPL